MRQKYKKMFEGSTKILYESLEPGIIIQHFKDDLLIDNVNYHINGKGVLANRISEFLMLKLAEINIHNHYIKTLNMREQLIKELDIMPIEVVVRNVAAGKLSQRLNIDDGYVLPKPIIEFYLKNKELKYPLVTEEHITSLGWADKVEIDEIKEQSVRINDFLRGLFLGVNIRLVDFKIEFGRLIFENAEQILLADEISPDSCRLWDLKTNEKFDRENVKNGINELHASYHEIARRFNLLSEGEI